MSRRLKHRITFVEHTEKKVNEEQLLAFKQDLSKICNPADEVNNLLNVLTNHLIIEKQARTEVIKNLTSATAKDVEQKTKVWRKALENVKNTMNELV